MAGLHKHSSVIEVTRLVHRHGGTVSAIERGGRHIKLKVVTRSGNHLIILASKAKRDPHKLKGWVRQEMNRADARRPVE